VRLTVTDDDDVPNSDISDVRIGQAPVAPTARPGGPYSQADGMAVQFDGTASTDPDGLITLYEWDFENNGNVDDSSGPEPEYLYPGPGNYTVSLKVTDNDTLTDTRTASVTIGIGNRAPAADAGAKAYPGVVGTEVQFDGSGSSDPDGDSLTYSWNYGDGSDPGVGVSPRHTYSTAGPWKVILTVTDDDDVPSSDTTIALIGSGTQPPVADAGGPYDTIGAAIVFDGNGSSDPDGGNLTYLWDFGDGGFRSGVTPTHVYTAEGTFDVTLTVIDDTGKTAVDTTKAKVGFGLDPEVGCRDAGKQSVFLKDKKGKFKWNWKQGAATAKADFGNPLTATDYQVCLFDSVADELFPGFCVVVPAGADWKDKKKGFTYKSKTGVEGITKIVLKAGEGGKAKIKVRGKGMDLPRLPLSQNPEVVVLISNDAGVCWKSRFSTAKKNDEKKFKAK